jgi:predicted lipoprotein with Yx(FWY)xxD motif
VRLVTARRGIHWIGAIALAAGAAALLFALSGPGDDAGAADPDAAAAEKKKRTKVTLIETRFGDVLADGKGFALYLFTRDQEEAPPGGAEESRCYGSCAKAWPVLRKRDKVRAGAGVSKDLLATTTRRNGNRQVTYNGHPLYYYVGDTRPEQVLCQDVQEFGGRWYVVKADGEPVV